MKNVFLALCLILGIRGQAGAAVYPDCTPEDWQMGLCFDPTPQVQQAVTSTAWSLGYAPTQAQACSSGTFGGVVSIQCTETFGLGWGTVWLTCNNEYDAYTGADLGGWCSICTPPSVGQIGGTRECITVLD